MKVKTISIEEKHDIWLENNSINLSKLVQKSLDKEMDLKNKNIETRNFKAQIKKIDDLLAFIIIPKDEVDLNGYKENDWVEIELNFLNI